MSAAPYQAARVRRPDPRDGSPREGPGGRDGSDGRPLVESTVLAELRTADPTILEYLVPLFVEDARGRIEAMRAAVGTGDRAALGRAAHTLKGSSASLGAVRAAHLCERLEAVEPETALSVASTLLAELAAVLEQTFARLGDEAATA